jgi:hypothetical protein
VPNAQDTRLTAEQPLDRRGMQPHPLSEITAGEVLLRFVRILHD